VMKHGADVVLAKVVIASGIQQMLMPDGVQDARRGQLGVS